MITEDYVSFETAKLLKEKGFSSDDCHYFYDKNGKVYMHGDYSKNTCVCADRPTLQMVMKWFRKEKNIFINIIPDYSYKEGLRNYTADIWHKDGVAHFTFKKDETHEEISDFLIKYSLENIVETPQEEDKEIKWKRGYPKPHVPVLILRYGNVVEEGEYCGNDSGNVWYQYRWGTFIGDSEVTAWMPKQCLTTVPHPEEYERINEIHEQN